MSTSTSLPRSKSTSHVDPSSSRRAEEHRPRLPRHSSAAALTTSIVPLHSSGVVSHNNRYNNGHRQHSWTELDEDPFNLGGFFPPPRPRVDSIESKAEGEWDWLRSEELEGSQVSSSEPSTSSWSGYVSPVSDEEEEEDADPCSLGQIFDEITNLGASKAIELEDRFGILSFDEIFGSRKRDDPLVSASLLSPYCEDAAVDSDALYNALRAMRQAHISTSIDGVEKLAPSTGLFLPTGSTEDLLQDDVMQGGLYQRLRRVIDLFSV